MNKKYEVTWKITGKMEVSAPNSDMAEEIINNIEDPLEIINHSIMIDVETTGASHIPWSG
jgi:hypothetical protein